MHAIALALFPPFAVGTRASLERRMITEQAETAFPHVHEIVHVDTALAIRRTEAMLRPACIQDDYERALFLL